MNDYYGFIYLWTNTHPDVKKHSKYIGQHIGNENDGYIGSGVIFKKRYYAKKYKGFWVRTILTYCSNLDEINNAEAFWIHRYNAVLNEDFCNCRFGGKNSKHGPGTLEKISLSCKGRTPWNKGKVGVLVQTKASIEKRIKTLIKNKNYDKRDQQILDYITENTWYKLSEHTFLSKLKDANCIKRLRNKKLIKLEYFGLNDVRYVLPDWSIENQIYNFIKNNDKCTKKEVVDYATDKVIIKKCKVNTVMCKMVKENKLINNRGYRVNLWSIK